MKVLYLGTDGSKSGASLSMIGVAKEARKYGIEVSIIIPSHGELEEELIKEKIRYSVVPTFNWIEEKNKKPLITHVKRWVKKIWNLWGEHRIYSIMKKENPDIVHLNTICSGSGAISAIRQKRKLVWHIREFVEEDHGYRFWNKKKTYKLLSRAELIIAISKSVYDKFSRDLPNADIKVIYNGVDVDKFLNRNHQIFSNLPRIDILMGGSIAESKGQHELIEAAKLLKSDKEHEYKIHFAGKARPEYLEKLKCMVIQYELAHMVEFEGFKDNMNQIWAKADIAVVCSRAEAFGRVTVEAMLSGALVIGANTAGTSELIDNMKTGLLYKQGDSRDLASTIKYAAQNNKMMKKIAYEGQKQAEEKYTSVRNAKEIVQAYQEILRIYG